MAFPKSRILSTQQLVRQIIESNRNGERFCFILGAGASVESGIPSGTALQMRWMDCLMGEADDVTTPAMDPEDTRQCGIALYEDRLIEHSFDEIEEAWRQAKADGQPMPSEYYFDIYKLRFYPNRRNGHRYLERMMESCEPSLGYHTLALLLAGNTQNNLVITTNFDSLVEDALFLYTDKKPLVVSHESLAGYIESDIQRPIIAKVHRGLMYAPFNSPDTTNELKNEWRGALRYVLNTYTPIVIGYGGGDRSLMSFLEEETTNMPHGVYWCYHEAYGFPDEKIRSFIERKNGHFVTIGGFDALMLKIGSMLYKDEITYAGTDAYLENQYRTRARLYRSQLEALSKKSEMQKEIRAMNAAERTGEKRPERRAEWKPERKPERRPEWTPERKPEWTPEPKQEEKPTLAPSDYIRRGNQACDERNYRKAIEEYQQAVKLDPNYAMAYYNCGVVYNMLGQYEKAIAECTKAISLDPQHVAAYTTRGIAYKNLGQMQKAIEDYTMAAELDPKDASAYNNRANAYFALGQHRIAIEDYSKAIELNPKFKRAYLNRAIAYRAIGDSVLSEADKKAAAAL